VTLLALDIGNTATKVGLFADGKLLGAQRADTQALANSSPRRLAALMKALGVPAEGVDAVAIASVVPAAATAWKRFCQAALGRRAFTISATIPTMLKIAYEPPESLGPDRLVNAIGASHACRPPAICASLGTATVVDVIGADYTFRGGAILPGVGLFASSLAERTALLPATELVAPESVIGNSTAAAIQSGAIYGSAAALEGIAARLRKEMGGRTHLVLTGGYASLLLPYLQSRWLHKPTLSLEGIYLAWQYAQEAKRKSE
jgi:type III pantothenate kinase